MVKPVFFKLARQLMPRIFLRKKRLNTAFRVTEETDCAGMYAKQISKETNHSLGGRALCVGMSALQRVIIMLRNTQLL